MKIFNKNEIRKRWIIMVFGILSFTVLSYKFAIQKTVDLTLKYVTLNAVSIKTNENSITISESKAVALTSFLAQYTADTIQIRKKLLDNINNLCNQYHCSIKAFPNSTTHTEYNRSLLNNSIELEGSYFNLLKIINELETTTFYGKVNACKFFTIEELRSKKKSLRLHIYLQHLTKI
jgi:hypothetical protein